MQEAHSNKYPNDFEDEIDLRELLNVLFEGKWIIVSLTAFVSIIGVIYSLSLPNIYASKAMLVPVNSSNGNSGAMASYGGLAGLAGISLSSSGDDSNSTKAIIKLSSLSFFENNILPNIFLPDLMAVKSWNPSTNTIIYDENIYNNNSSTWVRDYSYPNKQIPSTQESFRIFVGEHININQDEMTGFVTLIIKHQSPFVAKKWAEVLVEEVNSFYRQKDRLASEKAVSYLNKQIAMTSLSEIKQVIAELLQEETQKLTLIEANESYVFDYIDPPAAMEKKSEPSRSLICILSAIFGGMMSIFLVLIRYFMFRENVF